MTCSLDKRTLILWQLRCALILSLPIIAAFLFSFLTGIFLIVAAAFILISLAFIFVFLPLYFKSYLITVNDGAIIVKRGVVIKTAHILPFPRLVFARSFSTPLARAFGLTGVALKAARGHLIIPEMQSDDAKRLVEGLSGGKTDEAQL